MGVSNIGLSLATTLAATSSAARSIMAVKNDQKRGVFRDLKGDLFRESPLRKPIRGMGCGGAKGILGFFSEPVENFLNLIRIVSIATATRLETFFDRPKKSLKTPRTPFHPPPGFARQR
jgi:hypothetical protein